MLKGNKNSHTFTKIRVISKEEKLKHPYALTVYVGKTAIITVCNYCHLLEHGKIT